MRFNNKIYLTRFIQILILFLGLCLCLNSCRRKKHHKNTSSISKSDSHKIDEVIKKVRAYTGTPYKFGGNNKLGLDCSGLLHTSFQDAGIEIPRTTKEQVVFGKEVKMKDLQKGDWIFFTDNQGSSKITHVGMVTEVHSDSDVKFIHAGNKLGVIEEQLYLNYWQKVYLKAVRPQCFED